MEFFQQPKPIGPAEIPKEKDLNELINEMYEEKDNQYDIPTLARKKAVARAPMKKKKAA